MKASLWRAGSALQPPGCGDTEGQPLLSPQYLLCKGGTRRYGDEFVSKKHPYSRFNAMPINSTVVLKCFFFSFLILSKSLISKPFFFSPSLNRHRLL